MRRKWFFSMALASGFSVLLAVVCVLISLEAASIRRTESVNLTEARALAAALDAGRDIDTYLEITKGNGVRVTLLSDDGVVLLDNVARTDAMENHSDRPEFRDAAARGEGVARRDSKTLGEQYVYCAVRLGDGRLVRVARSLRTVTGLLGDIGGALTVIVLLTLLMSTALALLSARDFVRPLLTIDLDHPEDNIAYDELTPLLKRIAEQKRDLSEKVRQMEIGRNQLAEITKTMREGLIVLDRQGNILSLNDSSRILLNAGEDAYVGRHIYEMYRDVRFCEMIKRAQEGEEAFLNTEIANRYLEFRIAPVIEPHAIEGFVLLIVDATEKRDEERMRREFTANVSHELKTPLMSISGYAEIMQNGVAKDADMRMFSGRIYQEAQRMILLVKDILRLSSLDENHVELPFERVSLPDVAREAVDLLSAQAHDKGIALTIEGDDEDACAVRELAFEILKNLVDNAIRYNMPGGSVVISLRGTTVRVTDTGVGISSYDQERVFQRFYRVDKSHSKATGGTGLGLSIVKHAAMYLGAELSLQSKPGVGTTVTVSFKPWPSEN